MAAFYNENDPKAAAWLRELIKAGLIADGEVDTRSIVDVEPADVAGFVQCHWFAGIGGWSYALRLAGWPDERECWTGSCPCQPFSSAGAQAGGADARDLWPAWFRLIAECRPRVVFGEQVEAAIGHGWLDRLCDDMEGEDYACGPVGLPSACVGAFDIRQRLWFVADTDNAGSQRRPSAIVRERADQRASRSGGASGELAHAQRRAAERHGLAVAGAARGTQGAASERERIRSHARDGGNACQLADTDRERHKRERLLLQQREPRQASPEAARGGAPRVMGESHGERETALRGVSGGPGAERSGSPWAGAEWIPCRDGKWRPVEPGTFPLAHGIPARVGRLRGYGNAINPYVAKEVIAAYMEICNEAEAV